MKERSQGLPTGIYCRGKAMVGKGPVNLRRIANSKSVSDWKDAAEKWDNQLRV